MMSHAVHVHHAPRGAARHSRRGRVCWTRTLRRTRRVIRSKINRVDASARVIDAAGRFAPSRSAAAVEQLVAVAFRLAEAAAPFQETTGSVAVAGVRKISRGRAPPFASIRTL